MYALYIQLFFAGLFFMISGYHKLFNPERHAALVETFKQLNIPFIGFNQYWVPFVEFSGGIALMASYALPDLVLFFASVGLLTICAVAIGTDGIKRVKSYSPIDKADLVDDILYLPETLLAVIIMLCVAGIIFIA